ncbi:MAG TPA: MBL fold metallo-hydrolase [Nitrososphaerales archaeon]|nr:MBL fold metallo-hydrolase [Nitrososphaerales archaeon]
MADTVLEVVPGMYQIRLPIPIKSLSSVYVYLIKSGDRNLLIDTGWDSQDSYVALKESLGATGLEISEIEKIVVSHLHPDHFGLSGRLKSEAPNATVLMHRADAVSLRDTREKFDRFLAALHDWIRVHGAPESDVKAMIDSSLPMSRFTPPARPDIELIGGESIRVGDTWDFLVIPTPGHTAGNICLYDKGGSGLLFSGDHILPTITPNVSLSPLYDGGDPLGDYLNSLEELRSLNPTKILPSHEYIFSGLSDRIDEIEEHHRERLADALHALGGVGEASSAYRVSSKLRWYTGSWEALSPWEKRAALMETLAHLEYLKRKGKVAEIQETINGTKNILYSLISKKDGS